MDIYEDLCKKEILWRKNVQVVVWSYKSTDKNLQGYTPKPINTKEGMYCQRCFQLKHYGKYSVNKMTREDYKQEVGKLLDDVKLVIAVFDIIDF